MDSIMGLPPESTLTRITLLFTVSDTGAGVLVSIGKVAGIVGAHLGAKVVGGVSVLTVSESALGKASVVGGRAKQSIWALRNTCVICEESKSASRAEFYTGAVSALTIRHVLKEVDFRTAL